MHNAMLPLRVVATVSRLSQSAALVVTDREAWKGAKCEASPKIYVPPEDL